MIRCHMKDLKTTKIARKGRAERVPDLASRMGCCSFWKKWEAAAHKNRFRDSEAPRNVPGEAANQKGSPQRGAQSRIGGGPKKGRKKRPKNTPEAPKKKKGPRV